ncbi:probable multidrug resistance-associated protein lethal(2)03659 isoform X2 [Leptinotarsa decemlineata]|uniref:probable multidrug resistance-associated protein lethal(2)03659 isoform X2 n=1 Tax=Leptinotarsa decemlineata TaxID=7539 RepID=UPI003D3066CD
MDHCEKERRKVNPRERANIFSLITFSYLVGLFKKAFKRDLKEEDLYEVLTKCNSKRCGNKLEEQWIVETEKNEQPSVVRMLWRRYGWRYVWMCFVHAVVQIFRTVLEPYAITNLIAYFQPGQTTLTKTDAYHYGALLIFARLSFRFFIHNYILWVQQLGLEVKTSFSSLLYRKALRITPTFLSKITLGNIVTLVTKDVHTFKDAIWILSDVSYAVIQVCIVSYLIFAKIGSTSFIGIGVLFLSIPVQVLIGKWINKLRLETGEKTDERLQVTQETLSTIRIIKMYAWESFFQDKINAARRKEVNKMLRGFYLRTVLVLIGVLTSNLGFYILIIAYIWMGFSSDTTIVFYLLSNFHALRETLGVKIPYNIGKVAELMSAGTRVNRLIKADELHPHYFDYIPAYKPLVEMKEAKVHIGNKEILNIISLIADKGLTIVTGSVGSGKSSLLKTILQDYPLTSGNIISYGRISYASQDPWLFPSSIKQNILFGEQFNEKRVDEKQKVLTLQEEIQFPSVTTNIFELNHTVSKAEATENETFRMYSVFLLSNTILALMMTYAIFDFCRRASIKLHTALVGSVVNSVMSFFDSHFIGNVLNRFSEDLAQIDEHLPFIVKECLGVLFATIGHIGLVLTVDTRFIIYISIVCFLLLVIRTIYIPTGRSLKRLEASSRSPMIGHLNATLDGLTTIRAYKAERILIDEFDRHQDLYTSAYYTSICSLRGFNFFMDCIGSTLLISVVINFLFFDTGASAGNVGLALTQVTSLGNSIQWGLRQWSEMENNMTSVERVLEYAGIPSEKKGGEVLDNWPTDGTVEYENVCLTYNNEKILKNLTFEVEPKQRIGIVGRTGAGKSSLISSIFRLYDVQGKILIDGVDIRRLSLKFLRKKLAIIPQDPVLFSGTARTNLDPFREFEDEELWSVLEKVDLKNSISNLDNVIGSVSNFSSGQKQLFCLARALLRKSKILILDEATANMDHETDARLHKTISQHFTDCTVFIIAHRLHSILECDKVMVLDKGVLIEFDDPLSLLENENGIFHKMVKQAGLLNYLS